MMNSIKEDVIGYCVIWVQDKPKLITVNSAYEAINGAGRLFSTKKDLYTHWHARLALEIQQAQECLANLEASVDQFNDEEE
jgi:hypothetical protein